jgi:hypothetical protein
MAVVQSVPATERDNASVASGLASALKLALLRRCLHTVSRSDGGDGGGISSFSALPHNSTSVAAIHRQLTAATSSDAPSVRAAAVSVMPMLRMAVLYSGEEPSAEVVCFPLCP